MLGLGITLLAAFFVSLITTFARLAYDAGSNPPTQVLLRSMCMMLALGGLLSIVFGVLIVAQPAVGAVATVWALGAVAIAIGITFVAFGLKLRKHHLAERAA